MKFISGYQNTKTNKEDLALTPYFFLVWLNGKKIKVYGLGLCWFYHSVYVGIGFNIPKEYPYFTNIDKSKT